MSLPLQFASLFDDPVAKRKLVQYGPHTRLPTFSLTTTSLRHLPKWFDRLDEINRGISQQHGNFFSDPASIGLVNNSVRPRVLTPAGQAFLQHKPMLYKKPAQAEYQLIKTLYFSNYVHSSSVEQFLRSKQSHMLAVLSQFFQCPSRSLFSHPQLLVIAELVCNKTS